MVFPIVRPNRAREPCGGTISKFKGLREIQLREIQLGLRFMCVCAPREVSSPVLDSFHQALRARSHTFSTSKRLHSLL
jgi:hypothetical protein